MPSQRSAKDKSMAADLKKRGVQRTTGKCPWGCGAPIPNGGGPLVAHLGQCHGRRRAAR